jgi:hypothetical protein
VGFGILSTYCRNPGLSNRLCTVSGWAPLLSGITLLAKTNLLPPIIALGRRPLFHSCQATLEAFEKSDPVRMRRQKEVNTSVLGSRARWFESVPERSNAEDPAPLKVLNPLISTFTGWFWVTPDIDRKRLRDLAEH